ncbi:C2 family cysteine protease [Isoptericola sp. F-RaC21]|uniref:C2 family cysteine protease n=1 Tax=Isoptericola sp. F-RaC21 TaxID=3141452 RepID=UPI00315C3636
MNGRLGADPEDLRRLASAFERAGEGLEDDARQIGTTIRAAGWDGPDAQRYLSRWESSCKPVLLGVGRDLTSTAATLRGEARAQEKTSEGGSSTFAGVRVTGDSSAPDGSELAEKYQDFDDESEWEQLPSDPDETLSDEALRWEETRQGGLGDCWMLASLISVVDGDPDFAREHMTPHPNGTWTVTLYDDGEPVEVTVGPLGPDGGATDAAGRPNYATIYEAAFVTFLEDHPDATGSDDDGTGSYADIGEGGFSDESLAIITGQETQSHDLQSDGFLGIGGGEAGYDELSRMVDEGYVVLSTKGDDSDGPLWTENPTIQDSDVVPNHAYVLESIRETEDGDFEVVLRNPWGPSGGTLTDDKFGEAERSGTLRLTRDELYENFDTAYTAPRA